jgi:hypothetical protein
LCWNWVDNLIKLGLHDFDWWPGWISITKSTLRFFRDYRPEIVRDLKSNGLYEVAELVASISLVHMAEWRWHVCDIACKGLHKFLDTIRAWFHVLTFTAKLRDGTMLQHVRLAMVVGGDWDLQFSFVGWYCGWLTPLQRRVGGCICHPTGTEEGAKACPHKGRVLSILYDAALACFRFGLEEVKSWTSSRFNGDSTLLKGVQGSIRLLKR